MQPIVPVVPGFDLPVVEIAKDQPQYITLPCYRHDDAEGTITIRWQLSWRERWQVFVGGSIWHQVLTFRKRLQPIKMSTECPIMNAPGQYEA